MKFPLLLVDQKDYEQRLASLLENPDCLLLFDTNILSQMYSLHADARAEFAAWLASRKADSARNRVVLPAWCLHEYTNKFVNNKLRDYIPVGTTTNHTIGYSQQLMRHLAMSIDNKLAKSHNYGSREAYLQDLQKAHANFIKLLPKPDNDEKALSVIHEEIIAMFGNSVAKSDIFSLLRTCQADYNMRYENNLPPGFLDMHKDKNKLGDYIIWREILEIARIKGTRSFVYVSNDNKKDWAYSPARVLLTGGENVENTVKRNGYIIKLPDPRLEYELTLAAGGEVNFLFISFEQLIRLLARQDELAFRQVAEAVQVNMERKAKQNAVSTDTPAKPVDAVKQATHMQQPTADTNAPDQPSLTPEGSDVLTPAVIAEQPHFTYSTAALADINYEVPQTAVGLIIAKLKSRNWYIQNDGLEQLEPELLDEASADELFVLGRNILQAAMGSSFRAENYLQSFLYESMELEDFTTQNLFNGMLYEVYFDSNNNFRGSNGKAYYNEIFSITIKSTPCLRDCARFIQRQLEPFKESVLFIPFVQEHVHEVALAFKIIPDTEFAEVVLKSCAIDGEIISTIINRGQRTNDAHLRALDSYNYDLKRLMQAVCFSRYIPFSANYVNMVCTVDGEHVSEEEIEDYAVSPGLMV